MTLENATHEDGDKSISSSWEEVLRGESDVVEAKEEVVEKAAEKVEDKPQISPEENAERSRLGRRLSKQEQEISTMRETLDRLLYLMESKGRVEEEYEEEIDPDEPITLRKQEMLRRKEAEHQQYYKNNYIRTVAGLAEVGGDLHDEIANELLTNVSIYPTHTNHKDPKKDASINYRLAEANLLRKKVGGIKPNVKGEDAKGTGVDIGAKNTGSSKKPVQLDEYAEKAVKAWGLDDDFVDRSLNR